MEKAGVSAEQYDDLARKHFGDDSNRTPEEVMHIAAALSSALLLDETTIARKAQHLDEVQVQHWSAKEFAAWFAAAQSAPHAGVSVGGSENTLRLSVEDVRSLIGKHFERHVQGDGLSSQEELTQLTMNLCVAMGLDCSIADIEVAQPLAYYTRRRVFGRIS